MGLEGGMLRVATTLQPAFLVDKRSSFNSDSPVLVGLRLGWVVVTAGPPAKQKRQNKTIKSLELQEDFTGILNSHIIELGIHANIKEYDVEIMKIYARLHRYVLNIKDVLSNNHFISWQTSLLLSSWDSSGHLETYRSHCAASDGGRWRQYAVVCCGWWRPSWMRRWRSVYWYHWLLDWVEPVLKTEYYSIWTHCHPVQVNR